FGETQESVKDVPGLQLAYANVDVELNDLFTLLLDLLLDHRLFQPEVAEEHADEGHGEDNAEGSQGGHERMATAPAEGPPGDTDGRGGGGLVGQEPPHIFCQVPGAGIAPAA